ncbi:ABC transporter permease [Bradyrhizobium arachidis]|uniref:ABC transporter permease n=1 Tax=Bradyrhizobium arachidis TaxID=858423 RepID=UPI002162FF72|nr:ABC transporter permease [Bradyrhizobium arachidis]UVO30466.1 ABC transporter permease [Bradyrhizobium arachidis]
MDRVAKDGAFAQGAIVIALATLLYLYLLFPILIIAPMSFGNRVELVFPPAHYSLDLYRDYFGSQDWLLVTYRSARIAVLASMIAMLAGVPGAYALARTEFPGKRILVLFIMSPMLVPLVVISLGLYLYYLRISLSGTVTGLVLAHAMYSVPFVVLTVRAGIEQLDERLERAAVIMGARYFRVFREVVLPQLSPSLVSAALFAFLMSFDEVVIAWFITGPTTMTLPVKMYSSIRWESAPVLAAIATILTVLSIVISLVGVALTRSRAAPK